jgi:uncharacterized protein (TIGR03437 family)
MFARVRCNARTIIAALTFALALGALIASRTMQPAQAEVHSNFSAASVTSVNAASFLGPLAPGSIAAAFGTNLATQTVAAQTLPLPVQLGGTSLRIVDATGASHQAPLFFVSAGQINYLIPDGVALGAAQITVTSSNGTVSTGQSQIAAESPAVFSTTYNGRGLPVALTTFDGVKFDPVVNPDGSARAVNCGTANRPNYLLLFGTGLRRAGNVKVRIGGIEVTPTFAGAQGSLAGLDQINVMLPPNATPGMTNISVTAGAAGSSVSNTTQLLMQPAQPPFTGFGQLSVNDVQTIIAQAVAKAQQLGLRVTVAVVDKEANVLGIFQMAGAPATTQIGSFDLVTGVKVKNNNGDPDGIEGVNVPAAAAAISKAGTAAFFSTQGSGISTRTASFIIQDHFPPRISGQPGGPLFGVQFSQLLCSDIKQPGLPLGLSGDPGGVPIYKNGLAAGGVGIEGDGFYSIDLNTMDFDQPREETIAVAATLGYETPAALRIDNAQIDGMTLPYVNVPQTGGPAPPFSTLSGTVVSPIIATPPSRFTPLTLGGVPGRVDPRFFPFIDSPSANAVKLTASDVNRLITQAAQGAFRTRAAIRLPIGLPAEVNITIVDTDGKVLGIFSTIDAPIFGFDVSAQKARTAAFFSSATAGAQLRAAEGGRFAKFVDAAAADGVRLDGAFAFSNRAQGFLSRPYFPDGIDGTVNGPFSKPIAIWSPFNNGLQLALIRSAIGSILGGTVPASCTAIPALPHGIQIFAGSVPIFKNGVLVGAVGISGDGIDQDDVIASTGSVGFEAPMNIRADQLTPRGVRLPYVKFPRHPFIP